MMRHRVERRVAGLESRFVEEVALQVAPSRWALEKQERMHLSRWGEMTGLVVQKN